MLKYGFLFFMALSLAFSMCAQPLHSKTSFTRQDTLRGTIGPERAWWDVLHYDITVQPDLAAQTITGKTTIRYRVLPGQTTDFMQIDLQEPMILDSIFYNGKMYINHPRIPYRREGNVYHIPLPRAAAGSEHTITFVYHGKPRAAQRPPWDGGWIWKKDKSGNPFVSVACQGLGASVWYPCKDHQSDEPDAGATLTVVVPDSLAAVGNGRLKGTAPEGNLRAYTWEVKNPINTYNIVPYIGKYASWKDTLQGEGGLLDITFWALQEDLQKAKEQFRQMKPTLRAFEHWFGPYPFYEDGFQLVQAPHLGMEHQSAVAYGNAFQNGYLGQDLSGSGWGLKFDFIIVHESGHEWFANNVTTKDIADMWVHEGFTNYSEVLFLDYHYGTAAGNAYAQGIRRNIENDKPVIGHYGVHQEGSGDMYAKGASLLHTLRQVIDNDILFRDILRGLNKDFYHQTVTSRQVEEYITQKSRKDLRKIFDQYLRTTQIPVLEYKAEGDKLKFRWTNCVEGFNMPVKLTNGQWIHPTTKAQQFKPEGADLSGVKPDPNFYIVVKQ